MKKIFTLLFTGFCIAASAQTAFLPTSVVVYRVGDGSSTLRGVSTQVFLDEFSPTGTLIQSIPMPTTANGANAPLTAAGTATTEGMLTRSADGRYLMMGGYGVDTGATGLSNSSSTINKRVIGRVDALGAINTTTVLNTTFSGGSIRSVASRDGSEIWAVGANSGVRYTTLGDTATTRVNTTTLSNIRTINIFDNQLYISSGSGAIRVATVGTGTPTDTANVVTNLPGIPTMGTQPYQFSMINTNGTAGADVLYVADDASQSANGGVKKYAFNATTNTWDSTGIIFLAQGTRGLAARMVGTAVNIYVTTPSKLYSIIDAGGTGDYIAVIDSIATAATNTAFRGVALAPEATAGPLKLVSFNAALSAEGVTTKWNTANETGVRGYTVERSKDGRSFEAIGSLDAKNKSEVSYSFLDRKPFAGANYYRLKMNENDGSFNYSNIVIVGNRRGIKAEVFPNPALNNLTVSHSKASKGATLVITDATGKQVKSITIAAGAIQTNVALDKFVRGNYVVVFNNDGEKSAVKFMKQ